MPGLVRTFLPLFFHCFTSHKGRPEQQSITYFHHHILPSITHPNTCRRPHVFYVQFFLHLACLDILAWQCWLGQVRPSSTFRIASHVSQETEDQSVIRGNSENELLTREQFLQCVKNKKYKNKPEQIEDVHSFCVSILLLKICIRWKNVGKDFFYHINLHHR